VNAEDAKREAARRALAELPESGVIGLGSGSTAKLFIDEIGLLVRAGRDLKGVPTSEGSRRQAEGLGIPLLGDEGPWDIAMTVDGADEVDDRLNLIKGGGAAHTREKIVNYASRKNVIIVDDSKLSRLLGEKWPIPLEVLQFARLTTMRALERLGRVVPRERDGKAVITDAGNLVYDLFAGTVPDPAALDLVLHAIPGVVETGLFVGRADVLIVAGKDGVRRLEKRG
jgi:ribose 5-phosphate isomerase A